jgi:hypothetical protein
MHETPTIPDDMGVFLGTTYRMHSKVNRFISEHIYEDKLESYADNDKRIIEVPAGYDGPLNFDAGVTFVPVEPLSAFGRLCPKTRPCRRVWWVFRAKGSPIQKARCRPGVFLVRAGLTAFGHPSK